MNFLANFYNKSIEENDRNLRFWEDYLQNLKTLDFNVYSNKLKVPVLVPIGSRIFFRGDIKHTNEVTVSLGADYFAKCSLTQAEVLRQHRIKDAQSKVDIYRKEKEYLENQISFGQQKIYEQEGQEIVEVYTEEEDKAWREQHRENMRRYKQESRKEEKTEDVADEELWQRLEELELQEDLENELNEVNNNDDLESSCSNESFIIKDDEEIMSSQTDNQASYMKNCDIDIQGKPLIKPPHQTSKLDLLQQVIDRQNALETRLLELKNRERTQTKTENDLLSRLDEMEQLEDIEDEMDRLDDVLENEDIEEIGENKVLQPTAVKRQVTFADDDDSETLELNFQHSDAEPDKSSFDSSKGIQKPSDIFEAYPNSFRGSTSILKKSKYEAGVEIKKASVQKEVTIQDNIHEDNRAEEPEKETIVIKDIIERTDQNDNKLETGARPTSLFKKKRMQKIT